jgi:hypothetical protein
MPAPGRRSLPFPALTRCLGLACALALPAAAQRVVVSPGQRVFYAGTSATGAPGERDRFQFHATLEGAAVQPRRWQWRLVDARGGPLADAGTLTQDGLYTPPVVSLDRVRLVQVQATALDARLPSGAVPAGAGLAVIRPAAGLRRALERGRRPAAPGPGERVEPLAAELRAIPFPEPDAPGAVPGDPTARVAWEPRLPGLDEPTGGWLVAADDKVLGIAQDGRAGLLAQAGPGTAPAPRFTWVAAPSGDGAGSGRAVLWDARGGTFWKLDAAGRLYPWASSPFRQPGPDTLRQEAAPATLEGLAMDRQDRVYALFQGGPGRPGSGQVVRIDPDGTPVLLAGAAPGRDGALERPAGLALAPDGRALFCLDLGSGGPRLVRIALPDGGLTARRLDLPPYRGTPRTLGFSQGRLVLAGVEPAAFFQVDPDTGRGRRVYRDALRSGDGPDGDQPLRPGPCFHSGRARNRCGSLGSRFRGDFAADGRGRIAVLSGGRAGLVVLNWDRPGTAH